MPKISLSLSPESVESAIQQVKAYQREIDKKLEQVCNIVGQRLKELASAGFNGAGYDDVLHEGMKVPDVMVEYRNTSDRSGNNITVVFAIGEEAVFAEFGAGVYYNPNGSPNPLKPAGVVPIGTYGKGYGSRKIWGYYKDGELKLTHGTPASMPMYLALQEIIPQIPQIVREVFSR